MFIGDILHIPDETQALLWDMDGVLIDSLALDLEICTVLLNRHCQFQGEISKAIIKEGFALSPPDFWVFIFERMGLQHTPNMINAIITDFEKERLTATFSVLEGVESILQACQKQGLKIAVVSNNAKQDIENILKNSGLFSYFDMIVGNDHGNLAKKPQPDAYLYAASQLSVEIKRCVVIEDSMLGAEAGRRSGAFTIGVATGGTSLEELEYSSYTDVCYQRFSSPKIDLALGNVTNKHLSSPNEFVSHMVEHIAWRLGVSIDMDWSNTDWFTLGAVLGQQIQKLPALKQQSAALGMIDDGSAEVFINLESEPKLILQAVPNVNLDWFLSLRCEQLQTGQPLCTLLEGLSAGLNACVNIRLCTVEDQHHSWEGIFRAVGIALSRLYTQNLGTSITHENQESYTEDKISTQGKGSLHVTECSLTQATVTRETAESIVVVKAIFSDAPQVKTLFSVADTIDVSGFHDLLTCLAQSAKMSLDIRFEATRLNSSHVVLEDVGMVLGQALFEIFQLRMEAFGVHGAGGSVKTQQDFDTGNIHVGLSIEGRKFVKFVPYSDSFDTVREQFLVGQTLSGAIRSEDLDDFLDGFAGGLHCSIIVHIRALSDAQSLWFSSFDKLGEAINESYQVNPYRKGLPSGVKATLI
ncbi:MAG: HAD family phosphatase [Thiotrichaceae bacterium]|nr:HAD family phosphatase [Thiotrichaceae bacterium]